MKKILLITLLQLFLSPVFSQNYKFGKVSKEELNEQFNPKDTSANATVLYRKQHISFNYVEGNGFIQENKIHERIKIYNREGLDQAIKKISLYDESNELKEDLVGLKAVTYNIESNKITQTKLKKSGVFEEKTNDYWKKVKFTFPDVKVGSVIEYKYTIETSLLDINDVYFQQMIPIKKMNFTLIVPEYYSYRKHFNLKAAYIPNFINEIKPESITISGLTDRPLTHGPLNREAEFSRSELKFDQNWTTLDANNIPALKEEIYVSSIENYAAFVKLELQQLKFPGKTPKSFSTTWEKVAKSIYNYEKFGGELKKQNYYKNDLDAILAENYKVDEKIIKIFNLIKSKVSYNEINGYGTDKGVRKAYKEGVGNVADINLMLTSMLRYAGLKANPVLVSTVDNGKPLFPTRKGFNYVISCVEFNGEKILLDATKSYATKNMISPNALNWQGRLIKKDGKSEWVDLYPKKNSNNIKMVSANLNNDLVLSGKVRSQKTDYYAYEYRDQFGGLQKESLINELLKRNEGIQVTDLNVKNLQDLKKPIQETYNFVYEDGVDKIGSEIYISPMLFLTAEDNVFNNDTRNYPIDYSYPRTNKKIVNLTIPEGYRIKSIPESIKLGMSDLVGGYTYLVKQIGNKVQVSQTLNINFPVIAVKYYPELKEVYKQMIEKNSEKIVLEKI